jgi:hypothetical protein
MLYWNVIQQKRYFMQRNTSVTLGEHLGGFVENKIQQGRFESTSEAQLDR